MSVDSPSPPLGLPGGSQRTPEFRVVFISIVELRQPPGRRPPCGPPGPTGRSAGRVAVAGSPDKHVTRKLHGRKAIYVPM
ncbi:MAG: hypothetical protein K8U57_02345 [Planctomycetes bacterium]|nr:hypothetical protein [Planctomycetota bacterium]